MAMTCLHIVWTGSTFLPWDFFSQLPSTMLCATTCVALALTYLCHLQRNREAFKLWSWTHVFNTLLLFIHAWHFSLYWNFLKHSFEHSYKFNALFMQANQSGETSESDLSPEVIEEQNKLLRYQVIQYNMRASTAPAICIAVNFLITDWLLLARHSLILCSAVFTTYFFYQLVYSGKHVFKDSDGVADMLKMAFLMCACHFTHYILCKTQQSFRGRKIKSKDQIAESL